MVMHDKTAQNCDGYILQFKAAMKTFQPADADQAAVEALSQTESAGDCCEPGSWLSAPGHGCANSSLPYTGEF